MKYSRVITRRLLCLTVALAGLVNVSGPVFVQVALAQPPNHCPSLDSTGNLDTPRSGHTATLLRNGKVLVAGGTGVPPTAELYDPAAGGWSSAGGPNTPRLYGHTATLLQNGKVLVAGGDDGEYLPNDDHPLNSVEMYDPDTGTWNCTGDLVSAVEYPTMTLLPGGKVLVAGGYGGYFIGALGSAQLYDPGTGTWSLTGSLTDSRFGHTATLMSNGKVLVLGGGVQGGGIFGSSLGSTEVYDPATGTWSKSGNLNTPRCGHTATLLQSGKVLVAGGVIGGDGSCSHQTDSAELYNPDTGTWSYTGSLDAGRTFHTATLLPSGKVLVAGGVNVTCTATEAAAIVLGRTELYDPDTDAWSIANDLKVLRSGHTATLLENGMVLIAGGTGPCNGSELYDPDIAFPRVTGASVAGKRLFVFGESFDSGAVILLNGEEQATVNDDQNPRTTLIGKKAGKRIKPGDKLQVRNPKGALSGEFTFTGP